MNGQAIIVAEVELHRGWLNVIWRKVEHPNGGVQHYEIVNPDTHSVSVVAMDESDHVILVEMYRFGQDRRLKELPAGVPESGESLMDAIHRELLEETGYEGSIVEVGSHFIAAEHGVTRHVFYAKGCKQVSQPRPDQSEIDEGIKVVTVPVSEFIEIVRSGEITETGAAFMVLDHLDLLSPARPARLT
jgi:8-oxo-dGTP pyrophosphatase MutT (NUDIX family)